MTSPTLDLKRLAELETKATGGTWILAAKPSSVVGWPIVSSPSGIFICNLGYVSGDQEGRANGELIVETRNALPTLLAEIATLEAQLASHRAGTAMVQMQELIESRTEANEKLYHENKSLEARNKSLEAQLASAITREDMRASETDAAIEAARDARAQLAEREKNCGEAIRQEREEVARLSAQLTEALDSIKGYKAYIAGLGMVISGQGK